MKKKKLELKMTRRQVLKAGIIGGAGMMLPWTVNKKAYAVALASGLSDPAVQPKFEQLAPNALNPGFLFMELKNGSKAGQYNLVVRQTKQQTGLRRNGTGPLLTTDVWGYGDDDFVSWPGRTLSVMKNAGETKVRVENELPNSHLLPVDTNLHWCYSLHPDPSANDVDYRQYSIKKNGVPIITHLHGGNTDFQFDGNPEFFYTPDYEIVGPSWYRDGLTGIIKDFLYNNDVPAGNLWYHDHALGITRLNVYAGLAGFYFVRDTDDTGEPDNPLGLPAYPYELAYAIQDRMFTRNGDLFYPAFPGDPFYDDFITGEGAVLPPDLFPKGGPTALAEFFGDHMVVNGKIWPRATTGDTPGVEPRHYRMRLLNGTDSRFLVIRFRKAASLNSTDLVGAGDPLPFWVIGSDQGLASSAVEVTELVFEPGSRYDIVFNFGQDGGALEDSRIIMENIGGDAPFGGDFGDALGPDDFFPNRQTDRIMAFDVVLPLDTNVADNFEEDEIIFGPNIGSTTAPVRKVALFEGTDEFGRLQPLLGIVHEGSPNPSGSHATPKTWFETTTETPEYNSIEEWEIYNFTGDAHPIHLHLVNFEIVGRNHLTFSSDDGDPGQPVYQHNGAEGRAPVITSINKGSAINLTPNDGYVENAPKDMVTALPEQVTIIKAHFNKTGRYVWHCHILSHEDHEMMRVLQVDPLNQ
jgi:FtsP/CotA-like multicopper oxidase with cupredoxin domain